MIPAPSRAVILLALLALPALTRAGEPALSAVLDRAAAYVDGFRLKLSAIVAEEIYTQDARWTGLRAPQHREMRSDLLLIRPAGRDLWVQFRDVFEVDGSPVRDRDERLARLFRNPDSASRSVSDKPEHAPSRPASPARNANDLKECARSAPTRSPFRSFLGRAPSDQVRRIVSESSRYNIGDIHRTINVPLQPLAIFDPAHRPRFKFTREPSDDRTLAFADLPDSANFRVATEVWVVRFDERQGPTLVRTPAGADVFSRGRFWIEPATGRVLMSEIISENRQVHGQINVSYQSEPLLGLLVPIEMHERYSGGSQGASVVATAQYGMFRQLQ